MNSLQYNHINIVVNGQNIICESASLSQQGNQKPVYAINYALPYDYTPESTKGSLSLSYYMEIVNEPNYTIITGFKASNTTGNTQAIINLGGFTFTGYLNKLSFSVAPFQMVKVQASYDIFNPITGLFIQGNQNDGNSYNLTNASGLSNYFSTYLYSGSNQVLTSNVLQMDYNFNCTVTPIYSLTNVVPVQIYVAEAYEQLSTISELQNNVTFSGQNLISLLGVDTLTLKNQSSTWGDIINQLSFPISGMKHMSEKVDINTSSLILFQDTFSQSY